MLDSERPANNSLVLLFSPDVPYCDSFPTARAGWLDKLNEDMKAPDTLGYHPPPAHLMRPVALPGTESGSRERSEADNANVDSETR